MMREGEGEDEDCGWRELIFRSVEKKQYLTVGEACGGNSQYNSGYWVSKAKATARDKDESSHGEGIWFLVVCRSVRPLPTLLWF